MNLNSRGMRSRLHYVYLFVVLSCLFVSELTAQNVRINEMVLSNSVLLDEDSDTPDWFELYNPGPNPVLLNDWTITDDLTSPDQWTLPEIELTSDEYLLIWASDKDRNEFYFPRTHLVETDIIRYLTPNNDLGTDWRLPDYDDSSWATGTANLGYGDGDDITIIPNGTLSVFVRRNFNIADPDLVTSLVLDIDYDDAFVAYLNGVEIARANITATDPTYNSTAFTDREAALYRGESTERYTFSDLEDVIVAGENTLAIQLHNVNGFSSDMSLRPWMSLIYTAPVQEGIDPPEHLSFPLSALHTNFKLASSGEVLYLFNANGQFVDSLSSNGPVTARLSIGKLQNQADETRVFTEPSPAAANPNAGFTGVLAGDIIFSQTGGPVDPLVLTLGGVESPAVIRYTLDATIPTENSSIYTTPIEIDDNTVVRAKVFQDNFLPSPTQTETYLVDVMHDLPIISLAAEPDDFFDEETGIYAFGNDYSADFPYLGANFWEDWERPIHFALYEENGSEYAFDGGVKIFGGWSRAQAQRSLSIFARGQYGPNEIDYQLFPEQSIDKYQAIVLRNSGNDWLRSNFRDGLMTSLLRNSVVDVQAYRPTVAYLNGEFWGIYNLREKINEHFLASHHGVSPDDINLLESNGRKIQGDNIAYLQLIDFVETNDLAVSSNYDWVEERVDIANMILYQACQIYFDNTDWPGNNVKFWNSSSTKWRWILFDTDFGFSMSNEFNYFNNSLAFALEPNGPNWPNPPWATLLFRRLMDNTDYRNRFINQLADEMNSRFLPERLGEHIDTMAQRIAPEIAGHYLRWGGNPENHSDNINNMKDFAERRPEQVKQHILDQFSLPSFHALNIQNQQPDQGWVQVNSLTIRESDWSGDYFADVPIQVTAIPALGYTFSHWLGTVPGTEASLQFALEEASTLIPVFEASAIAPLVINEINYNSNSERPTGDWIELYNYNDFSVDLSNWQLRDSDDSNQFNFAPGTTIEAEGFLLVVRDRSDFQAVYPDLPLAAGALDFGLSSNGDEVRLFDESGSLQDSVQYSPDLPWPTAANGDGHTLELLSPSLDNTLPESWSNVNLWGSPGRQNVLPDSTDDLNAVVYRSFDCYPNPSSGQLHLSLDLNVGSDVEVRMYNSKGQYLRTLVQENLASGLFEQDFSLSILPNDSYQLVLFVEQRQLATLQWIKAR